MDIIFDKLPTNLEELKSSEYASLQKPEYTAALFLAAMKVYGKDMETAHQMIQFLQGPRELSPYDKQFLRDRMRDKGHYLIDSYFNGTSPENNYTPSLPLTVTITENPYSYAQEGIAKLFIRSSGADSPRPIEMKLKPSTNQWFLWNQLLLGGIRVPVNEDPWA